MTSESLTEYRSSPQNSEANAEAVAFQAYISKQDDGLNIGLQSRMHKAINVEPNSDTSPIPGLNIKQYYSLLNHLTVKTNQSDYWIINPGCTEHITHRAEWL